MNHAPILIITIPLFGAFLTHLTKYTKIKRGAELVAFICLLLSLLLLLSMGSSILSGEKITYNLGGWRAPLGISLQVDGLSFFFAALTLGIGLAITTYSLGIYIFARRYYSLLLIALSGILGIVLTRDIFNLYVFFEIVAVASYVLISYKHKPRTIKASFKYLIMAESSWVLFLLAIAILYGLTGTLNMDSIAHQMPTIYQADPKIVIVIFSLMLVAFGIKCGMFPMHTWIPEAHSQAPTPVSGLLSGLILKAGLYAMLRIFFLFWGATLFMLSIETVLLYLGLATLLLGAGMALAQNEVKKLLAYSSINQIGFILVGIGIGTELGLTGALFHILNHSIIKTGLFFCAGIIVSQTGFWKISQLRGVSKAMLSMTIAFILLSLAVIGIPPFNGFVSKLLIITATIQTQKYWVAVILFFGILLSAAYYFKVIQSFFAKDEFVTNRDFTPRPVGRFEHVTVYVLVLACLVIGLFPDLLRNMVTLAAKVVLQ
ncbi:MAG: NADH-quinone oxidoreductase subunit M [Candidatus Margulisbacteria bacterium]|nr:NADH-quinone oxidoreductase subunit M [Candidatus Margulisiibacteriota bacterium]MBU1021848.1 NADH-quinone oxidoreductase subunit M [Candidatus Margulisiibacteriota bacterium]MBU1729007.1 NADH-quinone oxidoreductase subunit M [Candidatus Margulisiibacteriota bacterium]MBU1954440.1 NADH-quinone oxidoreductase subunit M [Candidatus Margulisiibacteriota bacterium]